MHVVHRQEIGRAGQTYGLRCRGRYRRRRRRRRRPGHGAVQPLARQQRRAAGEGRRARRHHQEGGVLVLGARTTSTCRRSASRTRRRTACATWRGCRAPRPTIRSRRRLGMSQWEYDSYAAIYDNASPATELLADKGALEYRHCDFVPDYWAELPEDKAPKGRVLLPKDALPIDVGWRRGGDPHHGRQGARRRHRHPHRPSRPAHHRQRCRRGHRRRGRHRQGQDRSPSRPKRAVDLRDRRLHPRRRACARIS